MTAQCNVPQINGHNEYIACKDIERNMNVIAHYKLLSEHDQKELDILTERIKNYENEHETTNTI